MRVAIHDQVEPTMPAPLPLRRGPGGSGVTHHVRASLAGSRHELILVNPEREKSILLSVAPRTSQAEAERVAALLGPRQISPSELYRFKGLWPRTVTQPLPDASHA